MQILILLNNTNLNDFQCRLIVNGMSHTRCQVFNWLLVPLLAIVAGVLLVNLGQIELYLLWTYTVLVTASHIHYGSSVVSIKTLSKMMSPFFSLMLTKVSKQRF